MAGGGDEELTLSTLGEAYRRTAVIEAAQSCVQMGINTVGNMGSGATAVNQMLPFPIGGGEFASAALKAVNLSNLGEIRKSTELHEILGEKKTGQPRQPQHT